MMLGLLKNGIMSLKRRDCIVMAQIPLLQADVAKYENLAAMACRSLLQQITTLLCC